LEKSSGSTENDTYEGLADSIQINGKRLVMPYAAVPLVILYNKAIFDDFKISYPQGDWTWEQFAEISKKMKGSKGSALPFTPFVFDLMLNSLGKGMLSPDGNTSVGYIDSQEAVHTLKWLNNYYHADKANDKKDISDDMNAGEQFNNNQTGMVIGSLDSYTFFKNNLGDKLGVASLPYFQAGKRINPIYYLGFGISKNSKHPEAALAFMRYFTFTKHDNMDDLANYYILVSKSMSEITHQNTDPIKRIFVNEMTYAVKPSAYYNPLLFESWNGQSSLAAPFQELYILADKDIPSKLHTLAQKVDQEINHLKNESESIAK
jgi:ABC-type glycerol-3-phosphate transport system substrate-binding protein